MNIIFSSTHLLAHLKHDHVNLSATHFSVENADANGAQAGDAGIFHSHINHKRPHSQSLV